MSSLLIELFLCVHQPEKALSVITFLENNQSEVPFKLSNEDNGDAVNENEKKEVKK